MSKKLSALLAGLFVLTASANAAELNAYSIMPEKYASQIFAEFTKDTGIKVNFLRFSRILPCRPLFQMQNRNMPTWTT